MAVLAVILVASLGARLLGGGAEQPAIGGRFSLVGPGGRTVTEQDFRGRWMLVYFGYTHCPDVCPTTLSTLEAALDALPPATRRNFVPVFITVDPARDDPRTVAAYATAFGRDLVGLSGTAGQIEQAERAWHVYAERRPLKGGDYAMDHSSVVYVMRPDGSFDSILDPSQEPKTIADRLAKLAG